VSSIKNLKKSEQMFQALLEQVKNKNKKVHGTVITRLTTHVRNSFSYNNNACKTDTITIQC
jgi:hypothetical protein